MSKLKWLALKAVIKEFLSLLWFNIKYQSYAYARPYKYYWFIFRWFLIGRYHCKLPRWSKHFWWVIHKGLWALIGYSLCFTLAYRLGVL